MATAVPTPVVPSTETTVAPIVIDLGKKRRKQVRDLKRGRGKLMNEVAEVLERVQAEMGPGDHRQLVPVVMIYRKKARRGGGLLSLAR